MVQGIGQESQVVACVTYTINRDLAGQAQERSHGDERASVHCGLLPSAFANACYRRLQAFVQQPADQRAGGDWAADGADKVVSGWPLC